MSDPLFDQESRLHEKVTVEEITIQRALAFLQKRGALDLAPVLGLVDAE